MNNRPVRTTSDTHYKRIEFYIFSEITFTIEYAVNQRVLSEYYHKSITFATPHSRAF